MAAIFSSAVIASVEHGARDAPRASLYFAAFLIAAANAVAGNVTRSVIERGGLDAITTLFDVSAIIWAALAAGLTMLGDGGDAAAAPRDRAALALAVTLALIPSAVASMFGLVLVAVLAIASGGALRRAGIVFLAISGALLWGRLFLAMFSRPLLDIDAWFAARLLGVANDGNMLVEGAHRLVVAPGCSSMQGLSLALLFWVTVNQTFHVRFGLQALGWGLAALAATVAINVVRIAMLLRWPAHFAELHLGWGYQLSMWTTLAAVAGICLFGARHEIFARR